MSNVPCSSFVQVAEDADVKLRAKSKIENITFQASPECITAMDHLFCQGRQTCAGTLQACQNGHLVNRKTLRSQVCNIVSNNLDSPECDTASHRPVAFRALSLCQGYHRSM
jgi:hypothetical protein